MFIALIVGVLGFLVFFVWDLINHSFHVQHATNSAVYGGIVFAIIGFLLGLLADHLNV